MTEKPAPPWLADLQARVGAVLRTPLDRSSGTLRATTESYDSVTLLEALDRPQARAVDRLAVYNRQYWFRLFGTLQTAFPLTARLLGHWAFNEHAAGFLLAHPPRGWDLERAAEGFEDFLGDSLAATPERDALLEAARLDAAWRSVFRAPATTPFRPRAEDAARLLDTRLEPSPATALVVEHWPLLALKNALASLGDESVAPMPARLAQPRWWALVRESAGIRQLALEPREAELFLLLHRCTVRDALAQLEAACSPDERAALPMQAQRWLARSVERGLWSGLALQGTTQL